MQSVSVISSDYELVLAQQKVDRKSHDITAVPLRLLLLTLKGAVVTFDGMGPKSPWLGCHLVSY
ncbi:MAG: hypothetical protein F6J98_29045 [Moorea sp. SIO4G2]|nr:hypothetical protein [Moorena sp. SIO4G2]